MACPKGKSFPLGATLAPGGVNFSVFAKHSTGAQLLLFEHVDAPTPSQIIDLDPRVNRTYHYWHVFVPGVTAGQSMDTGWPDLSIPPEGCVSTQTRYCSTLTGNALLRAGGTQPGGGTAPGDNAGTALKSVVVDMSTYDWEGDALLCRPFAKTIIYEVHVGGFTRHRSSGVTPAKRGTYAGLIEKIPYLQDLGVSAVELLPVFAFDEEDGPPGLSNYWGYQPLSFRPPWRVPLPSGPARRA